MPFRALRDLSMLALLASACGSLGIDYQNGAAGGDLPGGSGHGDGDAVVGDGDAAAGDGGSLPGDGDGDVVVGDGDVVDPRVPCAETLDCEIDGARICGSDGFCRGGNEGEMCASLADCNDAASICSAAGICQDGAAGDDCVTVSDCAVDASFLCGASGICEELPPEPGTRVETISDTFDGNTWSTLWKVHEEGDCSVASTQGRAQFSMGGGVAHCDLVTLELYDMSAGAVSVNISPITNYESPLSVFLTITNEAGDSVSFSFLNGEFVGLAVVQGLKAFNGTSDYLPAPSYWRFAHLGENLVMQSSSDGTNWTNEMNMPVPFALTRVRFSIGIDVAETMGAGNSVGISGFNTTEGIGVEPQPTPSGL